MSQTQSEAEPSIEEILESIRQIISDDDAPAAAAAGGPDLSAAPPTPAEPDINLGPVPEDTVADKGGTLDLNKLAEQADEEDILDLTEKLEEQDKSDLDLSVSEEKMETVVVEGGAMDTEESLVSNVTAEAASAELAKLVAANLSVERDMPGRPGNVTLEDITRDIMRPLIKTWLDTHLQGVIEKMVRKEIERISRKAMGE